MAKRSFRWCPERREMVEITRQPAHDGHFVRGEIEAFRAPDGTFIESRSQYEDYCARNNVVPTEALRGVTREADRYEKPRQDRALRELLWEKVDRAVRNGRAV